MTNSGRFTPIKEELTNLRDQVSKVLEDTFTTGNNSLPVDVYETADSLVIVTGALLGLNTASLDIAITEGHQVTISGETAAPNDLPTEKFLRRERKFGKFSRSFSLPVAVVAEDAKATFKNSVLTITIPKVTQSGPKVIKVTPVE